MDLLIDDIMIFSCLEETPNTSSIPSSPVTPSKTTELLNSTLDISPIASETTSYSSDENSVDIPVIKPLIFDSEKHRELVATDKDNNVNCQAAEEINGDVEIMENAKDFKENAITTNTPENCDNELSSEKFFPKSNTIQDRSSKLIHMISRSSPVPKNLKLIKRKWVSDISPSAGRIKKLMYGLHAKSVIEKMEEVNEDEILTFTREIPSPLAVPRNSILKRKFSETGDVDSVSPAAKVRI